MDRSRLQLFVLPSAGHGEQFVLRGDEEDSDWMPVTRAVYPMSEEQARNRLATLGLAADEIEAMLSRARSEGG